MNARYREAIKAKRNSLRESANALIAYLADAVAARKMPPLASTGGGLDQYALPEVELNSGKFAMAA
jgi:hypothetical protein